MWLCHRTLPCIASKTLNIPHLWQVEAQVCAVLQERSEVERLNQKCRVRLAKRVAGGLLGCPPHTTMLHAHPDLWHAMFIMHALRLSI